MQADMIALHKAIEARLQYYEHQHRKPMSTPAIAQMLATMLYSRRFFPYYTFNVLGGLDENGIHTSFFTTLFLSHLNEFLLVWHYVLPFLTRFSHHLYSSFSYMILKLLLQQARDACTVMTLWVHSSL